MTVDQIAILFHVDMMTNRYLKEEVQKDFDNIFNLTYDEALHRFRHFHNVLRKSKTKQYTGMGEGPVVKQLQGKDKKNPKHVGQIGQGDISVICFKCGVKGHISKLCKSKINPCSITTCNSQLHNLEGHRAMEELGKIVGPDRKVSAASTTTPVGPTPRKTVSAAEALILAQAKQQKRRLKIKRKAQLIIA